MAASDRDPASALIARLNGLVTQLTDPKTNTKYITTAQTGELEYLSKHKDVETYKKILKTRGAKEDLFDNIRNLFFTENDFFGDQKWYQFADQMKKRQELCQTYQTLFRMFAKELKGIDLQASITQLYDPKTPIDAWKVNDSVSKVQKVGTQLLALRRLLRPIAKPSPAFDLSKDIAQLDKLIKQPVFQQGEDAIESIIHAKYTDMWEGLKLYGEAQQLALGAVDELRRTRELLLDFSDTLGQLQNVISADLISQASRVSNELYNMQGNLYAGEWSFLLDDWQNGWSKQLDAWKWHNFLNQPPAIPSSFLANPQGASHIAFNSGGNHEIDVWPQSLHGFSMMDGYTGRGTLKLSLEPTPSKSNNITARIESGGAVRSAIVDEIGLEARPGEIEIGYEKGPAGQGTWGKEVKFSSAFAANNGADSPQVVVWLTYIDVGNHDSNTIDFSCGVRTVSSTGFTFQCVTSAGPVNQLGVSWLAYSNSLHGVHLDHFQFEGTQGILGESEGRGSDRFSLTPRERARMPQAVAFLSGLATHEYGSLSFSATADLVTNKAVGLSVDRSPHGDAVMKRTNVVLIVIRN